MQIQFLILLLPAILFALTIHEFAHGWVAYRLGDPTARDAGRLTLNPLPHLDPIGTIFLIITSLSQFGSFGWAKPVPVNPMNFSKPKRDALLVSLAGPLSNIITALAFGLIYKHIGSFNIAYIGAFFQLCIGINIGLSFFNLIPVPPLDGSHILISLLPSHVIPGYLRITQHLPIVFLIMIVAERMLHISIFSFLLSPFYLPFRNFFLWLISVL
jgi:Zn-dependent protease